MHCVKTPPDCFATHCITDHAHLCLAQGHLDAPLGAAGDRTSNLPVTNQPPLPPELS